MICKIVVVILFFLVMVVVLLLLVSALKNTPYFRVYRDGVQSLANNTRTTIQWNQETVDSDNYFDLSTYKYTPLVAGYYLIFLCNKT